MAGSDPGAGNSNDSSSRSSTTNTTNTLNQDRRLVTDNGSTAVSADNSQVLMTRIDASQNIMSDMGAIEAARQIILKDLATSGDNQAALINAGITLNKNYTDATSGLIGHADQLNKNYTDATSGLIDHAYQQNQQALNTVAGLAQAAVQGVNSLAAIPMNSADQTRPMLIAGVMVVAVVAFVGLRGK